MFDSLAIEVYKNIIGLNVCMDHTVIGKYI